MFQTNSSYVEGRSGANRKRDFATLALLDRQLMFREGLEALFKECPDVMLVGSISNPADVFECLSRVAVDVLLFEIDFPDEDPLRLIKDWSKEFPNTALLVVSSQDEMVFAERCIRAGARGFVHKQRGYETLTESIEKVRHGQLAVSAPVEAILLSDYSRLRNGWDGSSLDLLSDRELLVLNLVAQAQNTSDIAAAMGISPKTVGTYKERIKEKLSLENGQQLAQCAVRSFNECAPPKSLSNMPQTCR